MENYFDIVPHATGWIYVMGGQPSASFPSYALALKGARAHAERERHRLRKPVSASWNWTQDGTGRPGGTQRPGATR